MSLLVYCDMQFGACVTSRGKTSDLGLNEYYPGSFSAVLIRENSCIKIIICINSKLQNRLEFAGYLSNHVEESDKNVATVLLHAWQVCYSPVVLLLSTARVDLLCSCVGDVSNSNNFVFYFDLLDAHTNLIP